MPFLRSGPPGARLPGAWLPDAALALAIGLAGGLAAEALRLPLPMMLGSLVALAVVAVLDVRLLGRAPNLPERLRFAFTPVIGVVIGAGFTPELVAGAAAWLPSLAALLLFVPLVQAAGYLLYRRLGGLSRETAFFAAMPGGLLEAIAIGEAMGADRQMLVVLQFLRLILCIVLVPLGFTLIVGEAVGSAAGVKMAGAELPLGLADAALLLAAGVGGYLIGTWARIPGGVVVGPMVASAAIHLLGLTATVPPAWLIDTAQLVVGSALGLRFRGLPPGALRLALKLALANIALALGAAFAFALALHRAAGEGLGTVLLAFAPGGVAEMSLVAISLQASLAFVGTHHVVRILLAVAVAQLAVRWWRRRA